MTLEQVQHAHPEWAITREFIKNTNQRGRWLYIGRYFNNDVDHRLQSQIMHQSLGQLEDLIKVTEERWKSRQLQTKP